MGAGPDDARAPGGRRHRRPLRPPPGGRAVPGDGALLGPDGADGPAVWRDRPGRVRSLGRRPGPVGPQGEAARPAGVRPARRPGARRPLLLRHRQRHRLVRRAGLRGRQAGLPLRPGGRRARAGRERAPGGAGQGGARPGPRADAGLLDGLRRGVHRAPGRAPAPLPPEVDRGLPAAGGPGRVRRRPPAPPLADAGRRRALAAAGGLRLRRRPPPGRPAAAGHPVVRRPHRGPEDRPRRRGGRPADDPPRGLEHALRAAPDLRLAVDAVDRGLRVQDRARGAADRVGAAPRDAAAGERAPPPLGRPRLRPGDRGGLARAVLRPTGRRPNGRGAGGSRSPE